MASMTPEGAKLLQQMEKARADGDLGKLKSVLELAKSLPDINKEWIDGAFKEIDVLEKGGNIEQSSGSTATASSTGPKGDQKLLKSNPKKSTTIPDPTDDPIHKKALEFKTKGNLELKKSTKSGYKEAILHYNQGIDLMLKDVRRYMHKRANPIDPKTNEPPPVKTEIGPIDPSQDADLAKNCYHQLMLMNQLHGNRAQAYLSLREWVQCCNDCRRALTLDSGSISGVKNFFRGARASFHNGLYQQALEFCEGGLMVDGSNSDLLNLKKTVTEKLLEARNVKDKLAGLTPQDIVDKQTELQRVWSQLQQLDGQISRKKTRKKTQELTSLYVESVVDPKGYIEKLNSKNINNSNQIVNTDNINGTNSDADNVNTTSTTTTDTYPSPASNLYIPVGRAFIRRSESNVQEDLTRLMEENERELPKMEKVRAELYEKFYGMETEFNELAGMLKKAGGMKKN